MNHASRSHGGQLAVDLFGPVDLYLGFNVPVGDDGSQMILKVKKPDPTDDIP